MTPIDSASSGILADSRAFLAGGGEMGALIRARDWAATPLGAPELWPRGLQTTLRLMLNTNHPIFVFWGEQLICFYNDACRMTMGGDHHPAALGQPGREVCAEIWHIIGPDIDGVLQGLGATWCENRLVPVTRNGRQEDIWWTYSYSPIDDDASAGGIGGVLVICADVTAQQRLNAALASERTRLLEMFKQAPGFLAAVYGPDHVFNIANDAYMSLVGNRNLIGLPVREALPELAGQGFLELLDQVYASGEAFKAESVPIVLDREAGGCAELRYVSFVYQPIRDDQGHVVGIVAEGFDLTDMKLADLRLREALASNAAILEYSQDIICTLDRDGVFQLVSPSCLQILGYAPDELTGRSIADFLYPADIEKSLAAHAGTLNGEPMNAFENRYLHKDGHAVSLLWSAVWVGEHKKLFAVGKDISARLKSEEDFRQVQKTEALGQMTGGVAHDFNNLLTVILGNAELISEHPTCEPRLRALADMVVEAAQRGADLTQGLLAFARHQPLEPKSTDVNRLIAGIDGLLRRAIGEHVDIECKRGSELRPAQVDRAQLESALLNLCINSRDAMPRGGLLTIETANVYLDREQTDQRVDVEPGQYVMVAVSDTGCGIPADLLNRVSEPFYTTKEVGKGTGLGLSMVCGFVKQSRGHVSIISEPDKGTTVKMYLPCADAPAETLLKPVSTEVGGGTGTILLVEDNDLVRRYARDQLVMLGYTVIAAENGPAALRIIEERNDVDLLLTDVVMPGGMSGRELADAARSLRPLLKILYTSGFTAEGIVHNGRLDPGVQLLRKPYRGADLARRVREAMALT